MQFTRATQEKFWEAYLRVLGLSRAPVILEMPEGVFLQNMKDLGERFAELQNTGVKLALDDFGRGYSSLAYLKRVNVDFLKIDPSFIDNDNSDSSSRKIAESIITMAHKLGIQVIAKGVETAAQKDWLKAAGCDFAQGHFFSRPLPAEKLSELLQNEENQSP